VQKAVHINNPCSREMFGGCKIEKREKITFIYLVPSPLPKMHLSNLCAKCIFMK